MKGQPGDVMYSRLYKASSLKETGLSPKLSEFKIPSLGQILYQGFVMGQSNSNTGNKASGINSVHPN